MPYVKLLLFHTCIIHHIEEINNNTDKSHTKFLIYESDDEPDEIMGYHELLEILEEQYQCKQDNYTYWQFKLIRGHQGPLNKDDSNYKGCNYNVTVEWEDSPITHEPLNIFGNHSPEMCAEYRQTLNLLNEPRWKQCHHIIKLKRNFNV